MYSLTFKLQPAAVVCNLNRSFTKNSRFIQPNGHSAIQISKKLTGFYWLRVLIRAGNFWYSRGDMRGFKNFKGSDSRGMHRVYSVTEERLQLCDSVYYTGHSQCHNLPLLKMQGIFRVFFWLSQV